MLTIENYHKLYKNDVGEWRVSRIEETNSAYLIQLMKSDGSKMQINLERNAIGRYEYELWCWNVVTKGGWATSTATPNRIMLQKHNIKDMDKLLGSIEFLIKDL